MSKKSILIICLLSSLLTSIVVSFLSSIGVFFAYHKPSDFDCVAELNLYLEPTSIKIKIGESFEASVILTDMNCAETLKISNDLTWVSEDSNVATVDTKTGIVLGISTGKTLIKPIGEIYRHLGDIKVDVTQ